MDCTAAEEDQDKRAESFGEVSAERGRHEVVFGAKASRQVKGVIVISYSWRENRRRSQSAAPFFRQRLDVKPLETKRSGRYIAGFQSLNSRGPNRDARGALQWQERSHLWRNRAKSKK